MERPMTEPASTTTGRSALDGRAAAWSPWRRSRAWA